MESEAIKAVAGYGPFAVLFVGLFFYTIKNSEKREVKYQETIERNQSIIEKLATTINGEICNIKDKIEQIVEKIK